MTHNLSRLYYKEYFKDVNFNYLTETGNNAKKGSENNIKTQNTQLVEANNGTGPKGTWTKNEEATYIIPSNEYVNTRFPLKVQYPGLVTGVGILHEIKLEGEFKLGVHFDYTYGMPVVYGSSVKGVLCSAFEDESYIKGILGKDMDIEVLVNDIFKGKERDPEHDNPAKKEKAYKSKSIYKRDIFFDAVIITPDSKGRILTSDSITPHGDNPLKNPVPITFLKIASGCTLEFRFKLVDSLLTAEEKKRLFKTILEDFGIGAKTNVGYGQLTEK